jgi:hypothetical protein
LRPARALPGKGHKRANSFFLANVCHAGIKFAQPRPKTRS